MSYDVTKCQTMSGGIASFKAKGTDAYSKMVLYGTKLLIIFPNNLSPSEVGNCLLPFPTPLSTVILEIIIFDSEKLSTVTLIKIHFF
jgi:hypothetical protein